MIGGRDNDEEYIPTQKELEEAQEEEKPSEKKSGPSSSNKKTEDKNSWLINFSSNKGNSNQRPTEKFTQLWEWPLKRPNPEIGEALYKGAGIAHTLVEVNDGKKTCIHWISFLWKWRQ